MAENQPNTADQVVVDREKDQDFYCQTSRLENKSD